MKAPEEDDVLKGAMRAALLSLQLLAGILAGMLLVMWTVTGQNPIEVLYK